MIDPKQMIAGARTLASSCLATASYKWAWLFVVLFTSTTAVTWAAEPRHILLLNSFGHEFSPWNEYVRQLRSELNRQIGDPIDIFEVSLATARFADESGGEPLADYLHFLFSDRKLDLVVTIGGPAAPFFHRYHERISSTTPAIFMGLEQRRVPVPLAKNEIAVASKIDFARAIGNVLHVLPDTENIVVVIGNSPLERFWLVQLRQAIKRFTNRVKFTWFNELPFSEMLARSAKLPPRSAIFFVVLSVDAAGATYEANDAVVRLHAVANAPIFSWNDIYTGKGIVGGPLIPGREVGRKVADLAARILNGEAPEGITVEPIGFGAPRFDWRELRRWNIDASNLPPGSTIEFREATIVEQYKWYIATAMLLFLIQAGVIAALLLNRRRLKRERTERQRAEKAALEFSERLINVQEDERSRLARELHDDITQRLAALAIETGRMQGHRDSNVVDTTTRKIREGLVKLSEDVHSLSYRLHPSIVDDLGLVEALKAECDQYSRLESIEVDVTIEDNIVRPSSQIALCFFRVAQEALQNISRHARAKRVEVSLQRFDGGLQICICDDGIGFDPNTRRERASLGLTSMQQRVYHLGGELGIDSSPGNGTVVWAWVPGEEERHDSPARAVG